MRLSPRPSSECTLYVPSQKCLRSFQYPIWLLRTEKGGAPNLWPSSPCPSGRTASASANALASCDGLREKPCSRPAPAPDPAAATPPPCDRDEPPPADGAAAAAPDWPVLLPPTGEPGAGAPVASRAAAPASG